MSSEYTASVAIGAKASEVLSDDMVPGAVDRSDRTIGWGRNAEKLLNASTSPSVDIAAYVTHECTGGDDTLDLTAIPHMLDQTIDATGTQPFYTEMTAAAENINAVIIKTLPASDPAPIVSDSFETSLDARQKVVLYNESPLTGSVSSAAKNIIITGTAGSVVTFIFLFKEPAE